MSPVIRLKNVGVYMQANANTVEGALEPVEGIASAKLNLHVDPKVLEEKRQALTGTYARIDDDTASTPPNAVRTAEVLRRMTFPAELIVNVYEERVDGPYGRDGASTLYFQMDCVDTYHAPKRRRIGNTYHMPKFLKSEAEVVARARKATIHFFTHEIDEWIKLDGRVCNDPHADCRPDRDLAYELMDEAAEFSDPYYEMRASAREKPSPIPKLSGYSIGESRAVHSHINDLLRSQTPQAALDVDGMLGLKESKS